MHETSVQALSLTQWIINSKLFKSCSFVVFHIYWWKFIFEFPYETASKPGMLFNCYPSQLLWSLLLNPLKQLSYVFRKSSEQKKWIQINLKKCFRWRKSIILNGSERKSKRRKPAKRKGTFSMINCPKPDSPVLLFLIYSLHFVPF